MEAPFAKRCVCPGQVQIEMQCQAMGIEITWEALDRVTGSDVLQKKLCPKKCYSVARYYASKKNHEYVEGFLILPIGLAIGHAWSVDGEGRWVDYTGAGCGEDMYIVVTRITAEAFKKYMDNAVIVREFEKHTVLPLTRAIHK